MPDLSHAWWSDLFYAFEDSMRISRPRLNESVLQLLGTYASKEASGDIKLLLDELYSGRTTEPHLLVNSGDPVVAAAALVQSANAQSALWALSQHLDQSLHEELVSRVLSQITNCARPCVGYDFIRDLLKEDAPVRSSVAVTTVLCQIHRDRSPIFEELPAYTKFAADFARAGLKGGLALRLDHVERLLRWNHQHLSEETLETYFRLVLDLNDPNEALDIARALTA